MYQNRWNRPISDPRIRSDTIENLTYICRTMSTSGEGKLLLVHGEIGLGAIETVDAFAEIVRSSIPQCIVIQGTCRSSGYLPIRPDNTNRLELLSFIGEALSLAVGSVPVQWLGQLLQTVTAGARARHDFEESSSTNGTYHATLQTIRTVCQESPTVWIISEFDKDTGTWLPFLLRSIAAEVTQTLPLMIVLSAHRIPTSITSLQERRLLQTIELNAMSAPEVYAWLAPCEQQLARNLHAATGGVPEYLHFLLYHWHSRNVIAMDDDYSWHYVDSRLQALDTAVVDAVNARLERVVTEVSRQTAQDADVIHRLLAIAALEGAQFTPLAVERCIGGNAAAIVEGLLSSELNDSVLREIDGFDLSLPGWDTGLALVRRLEFSSPLIAEVVGRTYLSKDERHEYASMLANHLAGIYQYDLRPIARVLARLLSDSGRVDEARSAMEIAQYHDLQLEYSFLLDYYTASPEPPIEESDEIVSRTELLLRMGNEFATPHQFEGTGQLRSFDFPRARRAFNLARQYARRIGDAEYEVHALHGLAITCVIQPNSRRYYLRGGVNAASRSKEHSLATPLLLDLSIVSYSTGHPDDALAEALLAVLSGVPKSRSYSVVAALTDALLATDNAGVAASVLRHTRKHYFAEYAPREQFRALLRLSKTELMLDIAGNAYSALKEALELAPQTGLSKDYINDGINCQSMLIECARSNWEHVYAMMWSYYGNSSECSHAGLEALVQLSFALVENQSSDVKPEILAIGALITFKTYFNITVEGDRELEGHAGDFLNRRLFLLCDTAVAQHAERMGWSPTELDEVIDHCKARFQAASIDPENTVDVRASGTLKVNFSNVLVEARVPTVVFPNI